MHSAVFINVKVNNTPLLTPVLIAFKDLPTLRWYKLTLFSLILSFCIMLGILLESFFSFCFIAVGNLEFTSLTTL